MLKLLGVSIVWRDFIGNIKHKTGEKGEKVNYSGE